MIKIERKKKHRRELDLVPMIDVVFFLLCYFLIAGTIAKEDAIAIDSPDSRTSSPFMAKEFTLLVSKDGTMLFEEQKVSIAQLAARIHPYLYKNKEMPLLLKADSGLPASRLTEVVKALEQVGVINLSLATEGK